MTTIKTLYLNHFMLSAGLTRFDCRGVYPDTVSYRSYRYHKKKTAFIIIIIILANAPPEWGQDALPCGRRARGVVVSERYDERRRL